MRSLWLAMTGLVVLMTTGPLRAASKEGEILDASYEVMEALADIPLKGIPPALMRDAQGVAVFPGVIKAGFVIGGRYGRGVCLLREQGDSWSKPVFLTITGGGIGWQIGVQSTDLVLIFKTKNSVERILKGKNKVTLGADLGIAAGPVGRQAEAGTDAALKAEIYSYSRSRGLFAGLSLEGAALQYDAGATGSYYRQPSGGVFDAVTGKTILLTPPEDKLRLKLAVMCGTTTMPAASSPPVPPAPVVAPPPSLPRQPN